MSRRALFILFLVMVGGSLASKVAGQALPTAGNNRIVVRKPATRGRPAKRASSTPAAAATRQPFMSTGQSGTCPVWGCEPPVFPIWTLVTTVATIAGGSPLCENPENEVGDGCAAQSAFLATPAGTAVDRNGSFFIADVSNNRIRIVNQGGGTVVLAGVIVRPGAIETIAGNGSQGYTGDHGPADNAELNAPTYVTFDPAENLYVADFGNNVIRAVNMHLSPTTLFGTVVMPWNIVTVAGGGSGCPQQTNVLGDGCPATSAVLSGGEGQGFDTAGNLYIPDFFNNRIRRVDATTGIITTVAGNGSQGFSGDGGPATDAELFDPTCVAVDKVGNLYIADYYNARVRRVDAATGIITTVAGTGNVGYSGDGEPATSADLDGPLSVAVDGAGNLYIADYGNERIRVVNMQSQAITAGEVTIPPGTIATIVGSGTVGYSGDGGAATNASLDGPTGLFVDAGGALYFADSANDVIRKIGAAVRSGLAFGGRVMAGVDNLNVRNGLLTAPALFQQVGGVHGTVVGGPLFGAADTFTGDWWEIAWDAEPPNQNGQPGWSAESLIALAPLAGDIQEPDFKGPHYAPVNGNNAGSDNIFVQSGEAPTSTPRAPDFAPAALGNCTWYAFGRMLELGANSGTLSVLNGDAKDWATEAGGTFGVDSTPTVHSIAQLDSVPGRFTLGHVAIVESKNADGTITVTESSYDETVSSAWNVLWRHRTVSPSWFSHFIHVLDSPANDRVRQARSPSFGDTD